MKANAPKKIYLPNNPVLFISNLNERTSEDDIEYTRTDAFIEKACEFLDGCVFDYIDLEHANVDTFINLDNKRFIDEFRKYMEGE